MASTDRARSLLTVGMGAIVLGALMIAGFGMMSLLTDRDVVEEPGLGPVPGAVAFGVAVIVWTLLEVGAVRRRPGVGSAVIVGVVTALAHLVGLFAAMLGHGFSLAAAVAGHLVTAGFVWVPLISGVLAATGVAVVVRSAGHRPEWPWEKEDGDE